MRWRLLLVGIPLLVFVVVFGATYAYYAREGQAAEPTGRIAFNTRDALWLMDAGGSNRELLDRSPQGFAYAPTWSPDGTEIAFVRSIGEVNGIFVIDLESTQERQISPDGVAPEWSPDGSRLAFVAPDGLALMNPDGTGVTSLGVRGDCPTWSPDGEEIAYCGVQGELSEEDDLYVMSADGSQRRRLTRDPGIEDPVAWSPDGERIAFFSRRTTDGDTYLIDADGTDVVQLTSEPGAQVANAWLPDGRIVIASFAPGAELADWYLVDPDDGGRTPLPQLAEALEPIAWLP
jgi:Tol biopolymer transport system component